MRIRSLMAMAALLMLATLSAHAFRLQFKDNAGDERTYAATMSMKGAMDMMGMSMPMTTTSSFTAIEKVLAVKDSVATVSYEVKDGKSVTEIIGMGDEDPQTVEQPIPGFTLTYNRTPQGRVSNIKMTGEATALLGGFSDMMNNQMQYPGQGLEFPDKELKAGDTWTGKQEMELFPGSKLTINAKYTLVGTRAVKGKTFLVVKCDLDAKMANAKIKTPATEAEAAIDITLGMALKGTGETLFDEANGSLYETDTNMNIVVDISNSTIGTGKMTAKMESKVTRTK